jgi:hypothetical protein
VNHKNFWQGQCIQGQRSLCYFKILYVDHIRTWVRSVYSRPKVHIRVKWTKVTWVMVRVFLIKDHCHTSKFKWTMGTRGKVSLIKVKSHHHLASKFTWIIETLDKVRSAIMLHLLNYLYIKCKMKYVVHEWKFWRKKIHHK